MTHTWEQIKAGVEQVTTKISDHTDSQTLTTLHQSLNQQVRTQLTPAKSTSPGETHSSLLALMHCCSELQMITTCNLANVFRSWQLTARKIHLRKALRQQAKITRAQKRRHLMHTARMAATASDQYTLFSHIRTLTPKAPRQHIRLRGNHGEILGPVEAADMIAHWLSTIYDVPIAADESCSQAFDWPFTDADLAFSLKQFSANKALATEYTPAVIWREFSHTLAPIITGFCQHWSRNTEKMAPSQWCQGELCLLTKPNKKTGHT